MKGVFMVKGNDFEISKDIYEYNVNHDAEWLASVCRRMTTSSEVARNNDYDKGWNKALHSVINIIEGSMIPPEEGDYEGMPNQFDNMTGSMNL